MTTHVADCPHKNHDLVPWDDSFEGVLYERKPAKDRSGKVAEDLYVVWITLNNPKQYNSYTTEMVKRVILAFRHASNQPDVVAVVFTGTGTRAFCTGGNTAEYAEHYSGAPDEYLAYMRLFNDMVSAILHCDKPVICRVNGMRIAGGQEIGMACDFTLSSDLAVFGQAGPRHGSAPDGGSTDFLPLFVGMERGMNSATLCESWSAHQAQRFGLISECFPVLRVGETFVPNPLVNTDTWLDASGRIVFGEFKVGEARQEGKERLASGEIDLTPLDEAVERLAAKLLETFPNCTRKTIESMRKHKLQYWDRNRESNRSWLGLNMMTEAAAGFRAFNEGGRDTREVDFVRMRQRLAAGERWTPEFIDSLIRRSDTNGSAQ
ncbi:MAG: 6-oxocyclohex-1-ene-1-carbonyl-CoA hydratase [Planctomycetes bacterium]|jgi:6-oxo-cyclohex-1-ene-carbonyl-CoA hydrolase|nr:6-oxocyclohex-1-ene-1-carbonyl-CoA hydratase [Planctomycetota bacterium]HJM56677.1 6-oxocyclohex-1-ene-1-carbonyl-CoA hydratase [Planctomycetota bacterium]